MRDREGVGPNWPLNWALPILFYGDGCWLWQSQEEGAWNLSKADKA